MFDSSILAQYGVTNLIDVDGLLYAPVTDLWRFYQEYLVDRLAIYATALASVVIIGWACNVIADWIVRMIRRKKSETNLGLFFHFTLGGIFMSGSFIAICIFNVLELAIILALLISSFNGNNKTQG